jgi:DNA-binding Xre family transcriptional regulator
MPFGFTEVFIPIVVRLDFLLAQRKVRGVRFETLDRIREILDCQPRDLLEREP